MALPAEVREPAELLVAAFCEKHIPEVVRDEVRLEHEVRGNAITIVERRPLWDGSPDKEWTRQKVAQMRFDPDAGAWSLFWPRASGQWLAYDGAPQSAGVQPLLAVITADPDAVFWG